jgi:uncharacterized membrane protein YbhN (UPF0104 family)
MAWLRARLAVLLLAATGIAVLATGIALHIYSFLPGIGAVLILGAAGAAIRSRQPARPGAEASPRVRARAHREKRERTALPFLGWYGALALGLAGAALLACGIAFGIYSFVPGIGAVLILGAAGAALRKKRAR